VEEAFQIADPFLEQIRARAEQAGLPAIHVSGFDARHLTVLTLAVGARKIVEIGTLAGLSGTAMARALPDNGVLNTFEFDPKHAAVAAETFRLAGLENKVRIHVGPALDHLGAVESEGPFDLVFIDADKENYPHYLEWAAANLRIGGAVLLDNAFAWGWLAKPESEVPADRVEPARRLDAANRTLASSGTFVATMWPTSEGLAMGIKIR
jgi:caffeoyl-CoA O-methyltransferase